MLEYERSDVRKSRLPRSLREYPAGILRERLLRMVKEDLLKDTISGKEFADRMQENLGSFAQTSGAQRMMTDICALPEELVPDLVSKIVPIVQRWIVEDFGDVRQFEAMSRAIREECRRADEERRIGMTGASY